MSSASETKRYKVLVTGKSGLGLEGDDCFDSKPIFLTIQGFGPFQNVEVNESWQAVSSLWELEWPSQVELVTRELPVVYDTIKQVVPKLWEELKPDVSQRNSL